jgi:hypothetical protein
MATADRNFWKLCRRVVRWLRISVLLLVFLILCSLYYLNQVGLPNFVKGAVLDELRSRGLALEFTRLRLHGYRGIIAENIHFGRVNESEGPHLFAKEASVRLSRTALIKGEIQLKALILREGSFNWPLIESNRPPYQLKGNGIMTEIRFLPNDQWELDQFQVLSLGTRINLSGTLTNASFARSWILGGQKNQSFPGSQFREVLTTIEKCRFASRPEIKIHARADARDLREFNADLYLNSSTATTPWGAVNDLLMTVRWQPSPGTNPATNLRLFVKAGRVQADWGEIKHAHFTGQFVLQPSNGAPATATGKLEVVDLQTQWGGGRNFQLSASMKQTGSTEASEPFDTELTVGAETLHAKWGRAEKAELNATVHHSLTNWLPQSAEGRLTMRGLEAESGKAEQIQLTVHLAESASPAPRQSDASWGGWAMLEPYQLNWQSEVIGVESPKLQLQRISCDGRWDAPAFELSKLHIDLYQKQLEAEAKLDVATRELQSQGRCDFDVHQLEPLLSPEAQGWLRSCEWVTPPLVELRSRAVLPAWTNRQPDWKGEVLPTLWLEGYFAAAAGAFRTIPIESAHSHFSFSNSVWRLPDFIVARPGGTVNLVIAHNTTNQDYRIDVRGQIDPKALTPLFGEGGQNALNSLELSGPASVDASVWGPWSDGQGAIAGKVALTNFTFRGERFDDCAATAHYTNQFVEVFDATVHHEARSLLAPSVSYDFREQLLTVTNVSSTIEPLVVARIIGPKTATNLSPYRFEIPPAAKVNGSVRIREKPVADLIFDISGGPFHWQRFNLSQVAGMVHWKGDFLTISNLVGSFYHGEITGSARFDFTPPDWNDFSFQTKATGVDLQLLKRDLLAQTNKLEGVLNCDLTITSANTADLKSWQGAGNVQLRDGVIWDIPAFGIFSPLFNAISPGMGNSRADEGRATFVISNSVIETRDLEIHASAMRLHYKGTVDFQGRVNARFEAKLLRDTWGVGPIFSALLSPLTKLFEYKVTGTLGEPKKEPLYIPKLFMMPFHPIRTIREMFPPPEERPASISPKSSSP